jgi:threonine dehydratase
MVPGTPIASPTLAEVEHAARELRGVVLETPLVPLRGGEHADLWLKLETLQPVGSFKLRGVHHAARARLAESGASELVTVSAGNTARALAHSARLLGVRARSLLPEGAPETKVEAIRRLGGIPVLVPRAELFAYLAERRYEREDVAFVHPWIDRDLLIGHGTLGLELARQLPDVETVFVPVGGGGLLGGVASALRALRPSIRILAVEPEGCPSFAEARRRGAPVTVACSTICDGVAVPFVTEELFPLLCSVSDGCVLVGEAEVRAAIRRLALDMGVVAEGAGALALAAALRTPARERGRSIALVTGSSIDPGLLAGILRGE